MLAILMVMKMHMCATLFAFPDGTQSGLPSKPLEAASG